MCAYVCVRVQPPTRFLCRCPRLCSNGPPRACTGCLFVRSFDKEEADQKREEEELARRALQCSVQIISDFSLCRAPMALELAVTTVSTKGVTHLFGSTEVGAAFGGDT